MAKLIFRADNSDEILVIHPVSRQQIEAERGKPFASEEDYMAFVQLRSQPVDNDGNPIVGAWRQCSNADIPASREFRNAWTDNMPGSQIDIDCEKARLVVIENMKAEHKKSLKVLNEDLVVAQDANDNAEAARLTARINAKKAALAAEMAKLNAVDNRGKWNDKAALQALRNSRDAYKNA